MLNFFSSSSIYFLFFIIYKLMVSLMYIYILHVLYVVQLAKRDDGDDDVKAIESKEMMLSIVEKKKKKEVEEKRNQVRSGLLSFFASISTFHFFYIFLLPLFLCIYNIYTYTHKCSVCLESVAYQMLPEEKKKNKKKEKYLAHSLNVFHTSFSLYIVVRMYMCTNQYCYTNNQHQ